MPANLYTDYCTVRARLRDVSCDDLASVLRRLKKSNSFVPHRLSCRKMPKGERRRARRAHLVPRFKFLHAPC